MNKTVIIVTGPTAVGKTALAIEIARNYNTAIISADSRQCFRELHIGVAKPSELQLKQVPHYFINTYSIHEDISAATFEYYALQKTAELFLTHDVIVMVGGTGLYIKAFCEGLDEIPAVDPVLRKTLQLDYEKKGLAWLAEELQAKDPLFAATGEMHNPQRMLRALEIKLGTGKSIVHYKTGARRKRPFHIIKIGLTMERQELYSRINHRVDEMLHAGLETEAKQLFPFQHLNALQTVGYKEFFDYFSRKMSCEKTVDKIKQNTRNYAKRQLTWFKRDDGIKWFNPLQKTEMMQYISQTVHALFKN